MYLIGVIFFGAIGLFFFAAGVWHEYTWWRRWNWHCGSGVIVGYQTSRSTDGDTYPPVIEYQFAGETRTFVSEYGSNLKPIMDLEVTVWISPDGKKAEWHSIFYRILFSFGFGAAGLLVMLLATNIKPPSEEKVPEEIRGAYQDPRTLEQRDEVVESPEKEAEKVLRFLEGAR